MRVALDHSMRKTRRISAALKARARRLAGRETGEPDHRAALAGRLVDCGLVLDTWYRETYPNIEVEPGRAALDYLDTGWVALRDPNHLFKTSWYLTEHPQVAAAGMNPLEHYLLHGAAEGLDPGPEFSTSWYLTTYPDVAAEGVNPLGHYLKVGRLEGRRPRPLVRTAAPERNGDNVRGAPTVVFVSGEPHTPGHQYRIVRHAEAAAANGSQTLVLSVPEAASTFIAEIDSADLLVVWRATWGPEVSAIYARARSAGVRIVFDIDDLMVVPSMASTDIVDGIRSMGLDEEGTRDFYERTRLSAVNADACLCPTAPLADWIRSLGQIAFVLPNGFDASTEDRSRAAVRRRPTPANVTDGAPELVRIGFAGGSLTHQRDLAVAMPAVAMAMRARPQCRLVLFRGATVAEEFPDLAGLEDRVEWRSIVGHSALPDELARFDINIAPLEVGNPFCESKSELKFFEAALVGVPTIASPTEPFRTAMEHGVTGLLATTEQEWSEALIRLIDSPDERHSIADAARRSVQRRFGTPARFQAVQSIYRQLYGPAAAAADAFRSSLPSTGADEQRTVWFGAGPTTELVRHDTSRASRVTVALTVRNYEHFVLEALDSVAAQTLGDLDLVVVDDASTDGSPAAVVQWVGDHAHRFNRALVISSGANNGVAAARNIAFDNAATPYVMVLDADNLLEPNCCHALLETLERSSAAYTYPTITVFGEAHDGPAHRSYLPYSPQRLIGSNFIDAMALVRTSTWSAAGGYRPGLFGWEDYDLWCSIAERGMFGEHVDETLARYRNHPQSMTAVVSDADTQPARAAIVRAHPWVRPHPILPIDSMNPPPGPEAARNPVGPATARRSESERRSRLRELLPIMRCPTSGESLVEDGDFLRSEWTGVRWPIVDARPVLFAGMNSPDRFGDDHRSNPIPERAQQMIDGCRGRVLHVGAGASDATADNVVEVEAALFGSTDVVADAHRLPFVDDSFDLVVALNCFEHFADPPGVVAQLRRVLKPGGTVFVHTAFLQPLHEAPHHFYNTTSFGLRRWFAEFTEIDLRVSPNFNPVYALGWLASECERLAADGAHGRPGDAAAMRSLRLGELADFWRDPSLRGDARWQPFFDLPNGGQEAVAAGFEYVGRNGAGPLPLD